MKKYSVYVITDIKPFSEPGMLKLTVKKLVTYPVTETGYEAVYDDKDYKPCYLVDRNFNCIRINLIWADGDNYMYYMTRFLENPLLCVGDMIAPIPLSGYIRMDCVDLRLTLLDEIDKAVPNSRHSLTIIVGANDDCIVVNNAEPIKDDGILRWANPDERLITEDMIVQYMGGCLFRYIGAKPPVGAVILPDNLTEYCGGVGPFQWQFGEYIDKAAESPAKILERYE